MNRCLAALLLVLVLLFAGGCTEAAPPESGENTTSPGVDITTSVTVAATTTTATDGTTTSTREETTTTTGTTVVPVLNEYISDRAATWADIPSYEGDIFSIVLDGKPHFTANEITTQVFELYSNLDSLGRCGTAFACCGTALMPTGERGNISSIKPSGWKQAQYDFVDGKYLYNRCHLIGWQLSGEDANRGNLITGTRYMNTEGMLPFENMVADYIRETDNHVMYRITPWFYQNELVARGVQIEAYSVEDGGEGICFNVFCHNVQPGVTLHYADGASAPESTVTTTTATTTTIAHENDENYVLNTNTKKIHYPDCSSAKSIKPHNREEFIGTLEELFGMGYSTCGNCF